jgi:hypothetical protein
MKKIIDTMMSTTGWLVVSGTASLTVTDWVHNSSSFRPNQVRINAKTGSVIGKTFTTPIDIVGLDMISINLKSRTGEMIMKLTDHRLKVRFYEVYAVDPNDHVFEEYYVPCTMDLLPRIFDIGFNIISRIEFYFMEDMEIFISEIMAYKDTQPYDVYTAIEELLRTIINREHIRLQIGTITCSTNDKLVTISNLKYADKHMCIQFGNEIHQIMSDVSLDKVSFGKYGDGQLVRNTYTNEPVYMYIPINIEPSEFDACIPSMSITQGFSAEIAEDEEAYSEIANSLNVDGTINTVIQGETWQYKIIVETSGRSGDVNEILMTLLKQAFNKRTIIWINGRKHDLKSTGISSVDYGDATEILSKIQVECIVECTEELWEQQKYKTNTTKNLAVSIMRQ